MISVLFVFIAFLFLCLSIASYLTKRKIEKTNREALKFMRRDIERDKKHGVKEWGSDTGYLYETVEWHFRLEIIGFAVASIGAVIEFLLAIGWR